MRGKSAVRAWSNGTETFGPAQGRGQETRAQRGVKRDRVVEAKRNATPSPALRAPSPRRGEGEKGPRFSHGRGARDKLSPSPQRGEGWGEGATSSARTVPEWWAEPTQWPCALGAGLPPPPKCPTARSAWVC